MYNLGHLGLYKNIPKKRIFNSTPDYERDAYTLLQYKSHLRNEFLIPLKANGDGSGVATIRLQSLESQSVKITGNGKFYTDASGATELLGAESTIDNTLGSLYVKVPADESCYLVLGKADKLSGLGDGSNPLITEATNAPIINGCKIAYKLTSLLNIRLIGAVNSFLLVSIDNTPNLIRIVLSSSPLTVLTGSIDSTPNLTGLDLYDPVIFSLTGDIGKIVKCYYFRTNGSTNCTFTYVTRRNDWTSAYTIYWVSCASMTSTMVDNLLIDLDASGEMGSDIKIIRLDGLCGAVTSASETARASLVNKGFTVVVNTQGE